MFIEVIDALRCPLPHEDSWLVGAFDAIVDRDVRAGRLGCPICRAEYPIVEGVVHFEQSDAASGTAESNQAAPASSPPPASADDALRIAAMLGLTSPGGLVILQGEWAHAAPALQGLIEAHLLLLDPPSGFAERHRLSAVVCKSTVPVAAGSCRGIAIHDDGAAASLGDGSERALRARGRLVIPARSPVPNGFRLLASDASWVVAERDAPPSGIVKLEMPRRG